MTEDVRTWIARDDRETMRRWLLEGKAAAISETEKAEWARMAAVQGKADMLRLLCERCHGMSYAPDLQGRTLLHFAAQSGDAETMRYVSETLGYDATEGDHEGITPLDLAKGKGADALHALETLSDMHLMDCYRNPVVRGFRPDPSILRTGEEYWLFHSSFVMVPALPISHSRDLIHWETVGHVFDDPETAGLTGLPGGYGYWAPDISFFQGRFWVVATLRRNTAPFRVQMITSAPDPHGPWETPHFLPVDGIDPSLFEDDDGKRYLVINPGVQIAQISDAGELLEEPHMIYLGSNRKKCEGPHLFKKDGWYYIIEAEGGTGSGHMITCARSRALHGPYVSCPFNPILGAKREDAFIGRSGHGKPVQLPDGRWAIVYLCSRRVEGKSLLGRETALDPLTWTADGWPMVNGLKGPSCLQNNPLPAALLVETAPWVCPRADLRQFAAVEENGIRLLGGLGLEQTEGAHLLLHRQSETAIRQKAIVDISGMQPDGMAGLTGYYDENSWYILAMRRLGTGSEIVLIEHIGNDRRETPLGSISGNRTTLSICGDGLVREAACDDTGKTALFRIDYLTDEGLKMGKRFTGAMLGLVAVGSGEGRFEEYEEEMINA